MESGGESSSSGKPAKRQAGIAFILITIFIDILGIGIVIPVLPTLVQELLGASESIAALYYGIIAASYSLMQFLFAPIVGALSDRFGRRKVILASLFGLGVDFLIQGFAPSITWLFIGRILAGVFGASITTANAYIADISDDETRARNFGLVGMMFGLGFICGPALGGLLGMAHLRLPFFVSAALALVNWLYGYFILPESLSEENRSQFTFAKANPFGTIKRLRAYPILFGLAAAFVCMSLAQRGLENVWVLHGGLRYGWDEMKNGAILCLVGVTAAIVQGGLVRPMTKKLGERGAVYFGLAVSALAFLGYGLASEGWMVPLIIIFGSLGGITGPAIQSIVAKSVGANEQGEVQGALTSLMSLTSIPAPLFFTMFLFGYFTCSDDVFQIPFIPFEFPPPPFQLPGAPFLMGSVLLAIALGIVFRAFSRLPVVDEDDLAEGDSSNETDKEALDKPYHPPANTE
ncbi:MAG: TCR/Tet family MFS transporter [Planctomycetota bacterium]